MEPVACETQAKQHQADGNPHLYPRLDITGHFVADVEQYSTDILLHVGSPFYLLFRATA